MKKIVSMVVMAAILATMFSVYVFAAESDVIKNDKTGIPDKALYRVILSQLGRKKGPITKAEAETITYINTNEKYFETEIKSLKGIGNFPNIIGISIIENRKLTSLAGIETLSKLQGLSILGCGIKSLSGVEKLEKLTSLYAFDNKITSIDNIKELTNLKYISFSGNKLKKLPDLRKLVNLEEASRKECTFAFNNLKRADFKNKLPDHFVNSLQYSQWLDGNLEYQNVSRSLKVTSPKGKRIKKSATEIKGKTVRNSFVSIYTGEVQDKNRRLIKRIKADSKGNFTFKKLNIKKFKGKKLCIESYNSGCRMGKCILTVKK